MRSLLPFLVIVLLLSCHKDKVSQMNKSLPDKLAFEIIIHRSDTLGDLEVSAYRRDPIENYYEWVSLVNDSVERIITNEVNTEYVYLNGYLADSSYVYWKEWKPFYEFILDIPLGYKSDAEANIEYSKDTVVGDYSYQYHRVTYPNIVDSDLWLYYYKDGVFQFCDFYFGGNMRKGERMICRGKQEFRGRDFVHSIAWYLLPSIEYLGTDTLKYINPFGDD